MERWYTSDTHFGHENIIRFCGRPYSSSQEMDEALIANWNSVVKPEDHVSHLGDVTLNRGGRVQRNDFIKLVRRLNGHKRLYLGNHDHFPIETYLDAGFEKIYATWRSEEGFICSHIPLHPSSLLSARANVHGHIHNQKSPPPATFIDTKMGFERKFVRPYINVCVEVTNYRPISLGELLERIESGKNEVEVP